MRHVDVVSNSGRRGLRGPFRRPRPARVTGPHGRPIRRCPARRCLPRAARCSTHATARRRSRFPSRRWCARSRRDAGCRPDQCAQAVLIPLGRSLQRTAAAPDFFAFPARRRRRHRRGRGSAARAATGSTSATRRKPNLLEVISYNEAAARFEFQLVRDYRAGGTPRVVYANRAVCTACHQNHAPIFSRQVWDETNANPRIAARLMRDRQGLPRHPGGARRRHPERHRRCDRARQPHRASRSGSGARPATRPAARSMLVAALQYRLSGERAFERRAARANAGEGLRRTLAGGPRHPQPRNSQPRPPGLPGRRERRGAVARRCRTRSPRTPRAARGLDRRGPAARAPGGRRPRGTRRRSRRPGPRRGAGTRQCDCAATDAHRAPARWRRQSLRLRRRVHAARQRGQGRPRLRRRRVAAALHARRWRAAEPGTRRARIGSGDRIERIVVRRSGVKADGHGHDRRRLRACPRSGRERSVARRTVQPRRDEARARASTSLAACCEDAVGLAPPQEDTAPAMPLPAEAAAFSEALRRLPRHPRAVSAELPRRRRAAGAASLRAMRAADLRSPVDVAVPPAARDKVPMPPPRASRDGSPWIETAPDPAIAALQQHGGRVGCAPRPALHPMRPRCSLPGYENLRPCLPAGA